MSGVGGAAVPEDRGSWAVSDAEESPAAAPPLEAPAAPPAAPALPARHDVLARAGAAAPPSIPSAAADAANPDLRFEALNRTINAGYAQFADSFQSIVDPGFSPGGVSETYPSWFAFAPYASHEVGRGLASTAAALDALREADGAGRGAEDVITRLFPDLDGAQAAGLRATLETAFAAFGADAARAGAFFLAMSDAPKSPGSFAGLLDPRRAAIAAGRFFSLVESAPGATLEAKLEAIAGTLRNALSDGNRRIYGDVGGAAERYLAWREAEPAPPAPEDVLSHYAAENGGNPAEARAAYDYALGAIAQGGPPASDFETRFPSPPSDSRNLATAGFALYELAGRTGDPERKNAIIAAANNLLAYREQHDAVQPAFTPGRTLPGEVDRAKLFDLLTPTVDLPMRGGTWRFADYAASEPPRSWNPLTPRATQYNWATFDDRWPAILDAFQGAYGDPGSVWPMPGPDPAEPLPRQT
jgi:hypothetical protein